MKSTTAAALFFLFPLAKVTYASEDLSVWVSNTYQTDFGGSNFLAFLELAPRTKNDNSEFSQFLIRPLLGYKLNKEWSIWAGYTWQGEYTQKDADKFDNATNDIMQQLQWVHDIDPQWNFQYRLRMEERFFADAGVAYRVRQRIRLTYTLPKSDVYLIGLDELFIYINNLNYSPRESTVQQGINQNRSYLGVGYKINKDINVDTGYQLQYVNNYGTDDLFNHVWFTNINVRF